MNITHLACADASRLPVFHGILRDITILGFDEKPDYTRDETGLHIYTKRVASEYPVVFKIMPD